jgi:hypothetical protein
MEKKGNPLEELKEGRRISSIKREEQKESREE